MQNAKCSMNKGRGYFLIRFRLQVPCRAPDIDPHRLIPGEGELLDRLLICYYLLFVICFMIFV